MDPAKLPPRIYRNLPHPVDRFQVLGDRCSGTNFISHLIERNFPELAPSVELGWKHGFIDRRLAAAPGLLTLVVYRHPLRWMQSVHRNPYEVSRSVSARPFSGFLRARWEPAWVTELPDGTVREEPIQGDMYPHTTKRFENICRMRSVKIAYQEELASLPCQVVFMTYEAVNRRPRALLDALSQAFNLYTIARLQTVTEYKGTRRKRYRPARYPAVQELDLDFMRAELDLKQEKRIGYQVDRPDRYDGVLWYDPRRILSHVT